MSGFQQKVNELPAFAVAGDFASANPRATAIGGPGYFVAPASGIMVGAFAQIVNGTGGGPGSINNPSVGTPWTTAPQVFVGRAGQMAVWYDLLQQSGNTIPEGYPVTAYEAGDFWMGGPSLLTTSASGGQKIFASTTVPGQICAGAAGATIANYLETKWYVAAGFTCSANELVKTTTYGP